MPKRRLILPLLFAFSALGHAQDFTYTNNNGTITITGYTGPGGDVTIPDTLDGLPVTTIGSLAFSGCTSLTSITIPDSVTTIGLSALSFCYSLITVAIPSSVTNIGDYVFLGCDSLSSVTVDARNSFYSSVGGILFNKTQTALLVYPEAKPETDYTISGSVTTIGEAAFFGCTRLTTVTVGSSVITIGRNSFSACSNLSTITIPDSVTTIGEGAFSLCASLTNVTIGNSVTTIGDSAFHRCTSLTNITVPETVTSIGVMAFALCTNLAYATLPNTLATIEPSTFFYCSSLTNITIPGTVTNIGNSAFRYCQSLTTVTIPDNVIGIGTNAFMSSGLTSVIIGNKVATICPYAFSYCYSLTAAYFKGNAPTASGLVLVTTKNPTVYYLPGTTGWSPQFSGRPTTPWYLPNPTILTLAPHFGLQSNAFGFHISWATNATVRVEASLSLTNPAWSPIATNTITMGVDPATDGWSDFSDPDYTNQPARFYRVHPH
jgi:hypothetical protein